MVELAFVVGIAKTKCLSFMLSETSMPGEAVTGMTRRKVYKWLLLLPVLFLVFACKSKPPETPSEGYVSVHGKKLWYKVYGSGEATPLVMCHGGPGFPSYYLEPLAVRLSKDRKVIVFDQIACGRSEATGDTSFMSIDSHVEQVDSLLAYLHIKDFYLYGHSYGTMLAMEYYLRKPAGIKAIIMASPCMSTERWCTDADTLISQLPDSTRILLQRYKRKESADSIKMMKAIDTYFATYYNRHQPVTDEVAASLNHVGTQMSEYMWGKIDFECTGTLLNYNRIKDLPRIQVPALFTCGEFDAARPITVRTFHNLVPHSQFSIIPNAAHGTMGDNPEADYETVAGFIGSL